RPGESHSHDRAGVGIHGYQTNARTLHFRTHADRLLSLDLIDCSHAVAFRDGWISVQASEPIADLHMSIRPGNLELLSSSPPQQLLLQGSAVRQVTGVILNGRTQTPAYDDRLESIVVCGSEWGERRPIRSAGSRFAKDVAQLIRSESSCL